MGSPSYISLLSRIEPQNVNQYSKDESWFKAMNEELDEIEKNNTWKFF